MVIKFPKAELPKAIVDQTTLISVLIAYIELQLKKDLEKARRIRGYKPQYTRLEIDKIAKEITDGMCSGFSAFTAEQLLGHRLNSIAKELQNVKWLYEHGKITEDGSSSDDGSAFERVFKKIGNKAARKKGLVLSEDDFLTRKNPIVEILEDIFSNIRWLQQEHGVRYIPAETVYKLTDEQTKAFSAIALKKEINKKAFMASFCQALQMDSAQFNLELWSDKEADVLKTIYQKGGEEEALRYLNKLLGGTLEKKLRERKPPLPQYEWGELTDILRQDVFELTHEQSEAFSKLVFGKEIGGNAFVLAFCKALQIKDAPLRLKEWDYEKATELLSVYQEQGQKQALRYLDKLFDGALEKELRKRKSEHKLKRNFSLAMVFKKNEIEGTLRKIFLSFEKESSKVIRLGDPEHAVLAYKEKEHYYFMDPNDGVLCGPFSFKEAPHEISQLIFETLFSEDFIDFGLEIDIFEESFRQQSKLPRPSDLIQELLNERKNKLKNKFIDLISFSNNRTSLHLSSEKDSAEAIQILLDNGANIAAADKDGSTALHLAAMHGNVAIVNSLLAAKASIVARDNNKFTALHWAAKEGHVSVVETLLAAKTDIAATEKNGYTALHWAAKEGHVSVVETLLAAKADMEATTTDSMGRRTALDIAAAMGHVEVVNALLAANANIAATDKNRYTALHWAAQEGQVGVVESLLAAKADIAAITSGYMGRRTALHLAAMKGHISVVNALLAANANTATKDGDGYTALHWAAQEGHVEVVVALLAAKADLAATTDGRCTALHLAAMKGHMTVVNALLAANANTATKDDDGYTALHWAAQLGRVGVVKALLAGKADIAATDKMGCTALHRAAIKGHVEVVNVLLESQVGMIAADNDGETPLHLAAMKGHLNVVKALLAAKADLAAADNEGETPLHRAAQKGHVHVVEALLAKGAKIDITNKAGETPLDLTRNDEIRKILLAHQAKQVSEESPKSKPPRRGL